MITPKKHRPRYIDRRSADLIRLGFEDGMRLMAQLITRDYPEAYSLTQRVLALPGDVTASYLAALSAGLHRIRQRAK